MIKRGMNIIPVKIPSGFILIEDERPYWYGKISFEFMTGSIIAGILLLLIGTPLVTIFYNIHRSYSCYF